MCGLRLSNRDTVLRLPEEIHPESRNVKERNNDGDPGLGSGKVDRKV
jgi:hypothetical protein